MDFKSLIKKFDSKSNNNKESSRISTREPIPTKKPSDKKTELKRRETVQQNDENPIMNHIYSNKNDDANIKENDNKIRKTTTIVPSANQKRGSNKFLSKINMFEKKDNNNQNNNKKEFVFDRNSLISPFMSDLDNKNREKKENKSKNEDTSNNQEKEEIKKKKESLDMKEEKKIKKEEKFDVENEENEKIEEKEEILENINKENINDMQDNNIKEIEKMILMKINQIRLF